MKSKTLNLFRAILRAGNVVAGAVTLGLSASAFARIDREILLLAVTSICLIVTVVWILLYLVIQSTSRIYKVDAVCQFLAGLLVLISGIVWLVSVFQIYAVFGQYNQSVHVQRMVAGVFGIGDGILYFVLGGLLLIKPEVW